MPRKNATRKLPRGKNPPKARRSELAQRLLHHLQICGWAHAGQRVGVAVSGGADSVALLELLLEVREKLGIVVSVVHFNHQLRGRASDEDERFVARLAERAGLPLFVGRENVAGRQKRERANLEDVARRARYAFFSKLAVDGSVDRVAVAHTADDQAETVLAHMFRGTGLAGLGGIHPEVGYVFRPLLKFRRGELREYLRGKRQAWREDATNRDTKRMRARIRLKLMPILEKQFQPAVVEHLGQLAEMAREDGAWLESSGELRVFLCAKEERGEWRIALADLLSQRGEAGSREMMGEWKRQAPQAMSKRMIRVLVKKVKPHAGQLSVVHVEAVLRMAEQRESGKRLELPGGVEVRRAKDALVFRALEPLAEKGEFHYAVDLSCLPQEVAILEQSRGLRFTTIDWVAEGRETKVNGAVLDRDRMSLPLVVRNWRPGDSLQPLGHQKRHKVSRLLNEMGLSRWEKEGWPVITCGEQVIWARGLPVAVEFAPVGSTRVGLVITEVPVS